MSRESKRRAARVSQQADQQASAAAESPSASGRTSVGQFLREVRAELKKVAWPSRKEVTSYTIVVLVTTLTLTALVWAMDEVIRRAVLNTLG
ncbi:MAG: preprotein translocase subunit SecE [Nitriliruptoraceae bacterium]